MATASTIQCPARAHHGERPPKAATKCTVARWVA